MQNSEHSYSEKKCNWKNMGKKSKHFTLCGYWWHFVSYSSGKAKWLSEEALQIGVKEGKWKAKEKRKDIPIWMQSSKD